MSNKKQVPNWVQTGHSKPVTRREFLAYGMVPFAASTFMPNWMQLLAPQGSLAQSAANCPTAAASSLIPFIQLNLAGGAGLMANFVPMDAAGNPLPSYAIMGMGNGQVPIVREFGNTPFAGNRGDGQLISNILVGIRERASAAAINKTAFVGMCVRSRDDSSENPFAMNGLANRAGLIGTKLPNLGTEDSQTGISQMPVLYAPPAPLVVRGFRDIANSLSYTAAIATGLNQPQRERLTRLVSDLSGAQARKLASITTGDEVKNLVECAGIRNIDLIREGTGAVDPRTNAAVSAAWGGLNANTANNNPNLVFGTMVYNTLIGQAGSASINIGGYDYHGNVRDNGTFAPDISGINNETTNSKDRRAGRVIGSILQTAEALQRPVFLYVTSDGAVSSENSETDRQAQFNSDRSSAGMAYIIMYLPTGRPATNGFQIGHFNASQSADDTTVVGNSSEIATQAAFANYCRLNNRMDLYSQIVTRGLTETARINQVVRVG